MNINNLIQITKKCFKEIKNERFYNTERGYQGRLYCGLISNKYNLNLPPETIFDLEYQKSSRHELTQRPDIILHIPAEINNLEVNEKNYAVFALKKMQVHI